MKPIDISVVVNTKNSQTYLERALKSVSFASDIVVVDMHSTDDTVRIARQFTDRIFTFDDTGYVEPARNFAIGKAKHDWVLVLDADEEIPQSLASQLPDLITAEYEVYDLPRKNIVFGKWLQFSGYWPDYHTRLFKKDYVVWSDAIHAVPTVRGRTKILPPSEKNAIIHHHYQSIEQYLDRLNLYTTHEAKKYVKKGTDQAKVMEQGFSQLFTRYFKEEGFKDNLHGLSVTFLQMFYQVVTQLKVWQAQKFPEVADSIHHIFPSIISQMHYWYADYRLKTTKNPLAKIYWWARRRLKV